MQFKPFSLLLAASLVVTYFSINLASAGVINWDPKVTGSYNPNPGSGGYGAVSEVGMINGAPFVKSVAKSSCSAEYPEQPNQNGCSADAYANSVLTYSVLIKSIADEETLLAQFGEGGKATINFDYWLAASTGGNGYGWARSSFRVDYKEGSFDRAYSQAIDVGHRNGVREFGVHRKNVEKKDTYSINYDPFKDFQLNFTIAANAKTLSDISFYDREHDNSRADIASSFAVTV